MKTMKWLLRRELWENKGSLVRVPVIIASVMLVFIAAMLAYGTFHGQFGDSVTINGHLVNKADLWNQMPLDKRTSIASGIASAYLAFASPLFLALPLIVFFYCLSALYEDRRDRSILFWKSLPVSDQSTVLSKTVTALLVAPLITIAVGIAAALMMVLIGVGIAALNGVHIAGMLLSNPDFYLAPLRLVGLLPVYVLWALPTVGYLLMVSAWARSKVFLWAVGVPLLGLLMAKWINFMTTNFLSSGIDLEMLQGIVSRALGGLVPGIWMVFAKVPSKPLLNGTTHSIDGAGIFTQSWLTLLLPEVWVGVVLGAAMIFVAMRLRRWRDEG